MNTTPAQNYLSQLQQQRSLLAGQDRIQPRFGQLVNALPPALKELWEQGHLAVGEVNVPDVLAEMRPLPDDGHSSAQGRDYVILMSSKFMQFLYAVARTLSGNVNVFGNAPEANFKVLTIDELSGHMQSIFNVWNSGAPWSGKPYSYPQFSLHQRQIEIAETLTVVAELFILAHEAGHVLVKRFPEMPVEVPGMSASQSEEMLVDSFAALTVLNAAGGHDLRLVVAGELFAVRVLAWLERMGFACGSSHPSSEIRLKNVRETCRRHFGDEAAYTYMSTIAAAFDDQLEAVEVRLLRSGTSISQSPDRVLVRLIAVLEECERGRLSKEECCKTATRMVLDVPPELHADVAAKIDAYFHSQTAQQAPDDSRRMFDLLEAVIHELPDPARSTFETIFKRNDTARGHK